MTITPLFDNVLIEPLEAEEKTASGIILPDSAKEKSQMGKVIAVGKGKIKFGPKGDEHVEHPMVVKVGDIVAYEKWGGNEIKVDGRDMVLISQEKLLAVKK